MEVGEGDAEVCLSVAVGDHHRRAVTAAMMQAHMGTTFFVDGVKKNFSCVHGSKMAIGEVMFLSAIAWVKGGERKILT